MSKSGARPSGPGPKRRRTAEEELRAWADEWPNKDPVVGKEIDFLPEDVVAEKSTGKGSGQYAVLRKCPEHCAARLRRSEKRFVQDWCQDLGVLTDSAGAVDGIKAVVMGNNRSHFTLPLVQTGTGSIAGYVHATYCEEKQRLNIAHLKVDEEHMGQGLGGLLIDAAEKHSQSIGWACTQTSLCVLKANERACKCYAKAGFRLESGTAASWGTKPQHIWLEWQSLLKVHMFALKGSAASE
eukprot:s4020_g3.t1